MTNLKKILQQMQEDIDRLKREVFSPSAEVHEIARLFELGRVDEARALGQRGKRQ